MNRLLSEMILLADPAKVAGLSRFFKTGPGQYGEGDRFLGMVSTMAFIRRMPRRMLRHAIEKFPEEERRAILTR